MMEFVIRCYFKRFFPDIIYIRMSTFLLLHSGMKIYKLNVQCLIAIYLYPSMCLFIYLPINQKILYIYLSNYLSVCLSIYLSIYHLLAPCQAFSALHHRHLTLVQANVTGESN